MCTKRDRLPLKNENISRVGLGKTSEGKMFCCSPRANTKAERKSSIGEILCGLCISDLSLRQEFLPFSRGSPFPRKTPFEVELEEVLI